jgi:hypothetical protein
MVFAFAPIVALPARRHRHSGAVGDAGAFGRPLRRHARSRGRDDAEATGRDGGEAAVAAFTARVKPCSVAGLLATVVLLFGFQGP